ncbi:DUF4386 domain-containing protein [Marinicrinis sediminis]|uniref:DUF4386 domain-containing protein n=1 Tax=Marinicrinis sediminis TaxID=1652465 RepID=A0ABW5RA77_9BACL
MMMEDASGAKRLAAVAGWLLLAGMAAGIGSVVPVIDSADYLSRAAGQERQVMTGAFFQFMMILPYAGIPVCLYPIFSRAYKGLSLAAVACGIMAGVCILAGVIVLLLLLTLSQTFHSTDIPDLAYFQTLGEVLQTARDLINHVATTLTFVAALLLLNWLLYRTRQVPRWLSIWGLVGCALSLLASLLFMADFIGLDTPYLTLNVPIAFQQLVLGIWLILKGI